VPGTEPDGCPHGPPLATVDGDRVHLRYALEFLPGQVTLAPNGARVVDAIARAIHHAGWDDAPGDCVIVTVPGDSPTWSELADRRSLDIARRLRGFGIRARTEARARVTEASFVPTPEGLAAGAHVH